MLKKLLLGFLFLILLLVALVIGYLFSIHAERPAEPPPVTRVILNPAYENQAIAASGWLANLYAEHLVPSVSAAVGINGQLVWQGVIGYADLENKTFATPSTQYRIGSISKPMTAVVLLRLQEQGVLNIDEKFRTYVDDFPASHNQITLKQLASHQAGIRHYQNEIAENFNSTEYPNTRAAAAIVEHDPLLFAPGEGFHYSTYGYTLLSLAMENAVLKQKEQKQAARSFEHIMQDELFTPLALRGTHFNKAGQNDNPNLSVPYLDLGGDLYQSPEPNVSNKYAGGGYLSTPTDLVMFANALLDGSLLSAESLNQLWTPIPLNNRQMNPENYALGFRVGSDDLGKFIHHGGKSVGGYSFLLIYPEARLTIAFATNNTPADNAFNRLAAAQTLARMFLTAAH